MNTQEYIEYLIQQQLNNNQRSPFNSINGYKNGLSEINNFGGNLKTTGDFLQGFDNKFVDKIGSGMSKVGEVLQGGVSKAVPQNVFKGFAQPTNPAIEGAISNVLGNSAANVGANAGMGAIGNAVADTAGSSLAGIGSTIGSSAAGEAAGAAAGSGAASGAMAAGPIGALVALGAMAIDGANRKRAKQSGENLLKQTNQMTEAIQNDTTNQNFANNMVKKSQNNISGAMTGGASPIEPNITGFDNEMMQSGYTSEQISDILNGSNNNDEKVKSIMEKYGIPEAQKGQVTENVNVNDNTEKVKEGLLSKFMSGLGDFSQGYQENRNTSFTPENLNQNRFGQEITTQETNPELLNYQNNLKNDENFNNWVTRAGKDKETVLKNIENGQNGGYSAIDEWIKANPEALKPVTQTKTEYTGKEKGKMARVGEGVGTIARALQKPAVQAILAGGLSTALTGNPLYGLGQAYKFANARAMNDLYRNVLKQNGIETPDTGMFGNVTSQDMKNIGNMAETHAWHEYLNQKNADELARKIAKDKVDEQYKAQMIDIRKNDSDTKRINAQANKTRADKYGSGGGRKTTGGSGKAPKPQQNPDWNNDLAGYIQRVNDPRYATKIGQLKAGFVKKYGVDPDKYIK